jgi:aspartyl-tRNA(Asn)/glutamyl-tRNA(Gln) amidotransferase subunit A
MSEPSIASLIESFRRRTLTPVEVWETVAARIEAWEPTINALYAYDPAKARREAEGSTVRWQKGKPIGPLDGVPVTVKELIPSDGISVPHGTAALPLSPATEDAPPVARLKEAGAIIFAKTTCPDLGMLSSGVSSFHGTTRNPWNTALNPGGSSSGAGAAGAAGYGPLHIGTDIGGSIRLPAGWCGLVGFKPSLGRIPIDPYYPGRTAGPMTRTVEDAAYAMSVLSRPDPRDAMSLPYEPIDWLDLDHPVAGLRIGVMDDAGVGLPVDPAIAAILADGVRRFAAAGAVIVPVMPILNRKILDGIDLFWRARAWNELRETSAERWSRLLPYVRDWVKPGETVPGWRAVDGFNQTLEIRRRAAALFQQVDYVISPTAPLVSFGAELASPLDDPARPFEHIAFTLPWNMSEQPAISLNGGFSGEGLPIGLQIVGRRFDDLGVLRVARWFEREVGQITDWPEPAVEVLPPAKYRPSTRPS